MTQILAELFNYDREERNTRRKIKLKYQESEGNLQFQKQTLENTKTALGKKSFQSFDQYLQSLRKKKNEIDQGIQDLEQKSEEKIKELNGQWLKTTLTSAASITSGLLLAPLAYAAMAATMTHALYDKDLMEDDAMQFTTGIQALFGLTGLIAVGLTGNIATGGMAGIAYLGFGALGALPAGLMAVGDIASWTKKNVFKQEMGVFDLYKEIRTQKQQYKNNHHSLTKDLDEAKDAIKNGHRDFNQSFREYTQEIKSLELKINNIQSQIDSCKISKDQELRKIPLRGIVQSTANNNRQKTPFPVAQQRYDHYHMA